MFILLYARVISLQPPSDGELSVTSGILGRLHKWKNESTVSRGSSENHLFVQESEFIALVDVSCNSRAFSCNSCDKDYFNRLSQCRH